MVLSNNTVPVYCGLCYSLVGGGEHNRLSPAEVRASRGCWETKAEGYLKAFRWGSLAVSTVD